MAHFTHWSHMTYAQFSLKKPTDPWHKGTLFFIYSHVQHGVYKINIFTQLTLAFQLNGILKENMWDIVGVKKATSDESLAQVNEPVTYTVYTQAK